MQGLLTTLKRIFFWNYERNTWQWDVLCVVILALIFLTPKEWLARGERPRISGHQSPTSMTMVFGPEVIANELDKGQVEQRVKALTGRPTVEVVAVRKVVGPDGRTLSFEVDIR